MNYHYKSIFYEKNIVHLTKKIILTEKNEELPQKWLFS